MKKTLISLATASLIASTAMAADKGIDFTTTGQAVVYYQTADTAGDDLFTQAKSSANVGVQLNLGADLGNDFTFGSQISYLGTAGLEKNLVVNTRQVSAATNPAGSGLDAANATTDQLMLTKIFIAKKIANTTVKIGRQELPKSLSPLAFSEGWNVFKNTFDAVLVVNSDIPDTTVVAAYVGRSTGHDLSSVGDLTATTSLGALAIAKTAYMLTVQNTSLPMTTLTASYYALSGVNDTGVGVVGLHADALWLDAKIADKSLPMGLKVGIQAGSISADTVDTTSAFGLKASMKPMADLTVCAAYTGVDDGDVAIKNTGTGVKTPLFTQMVANQNAIALDADTFMLKAAYSLGENGTVIAQGSMTTAGAKNLNGDGHDNTDLELVYKVKKAGVQYLAAYVNTTDSEADVSNHIVRVWARYAF